MLFLFELFSFFVDFVMYSLLELTSSLIIWSCCISCSRGIVPCGSGAVCFTYCASSNNRRVSWCRCCQLVSRLSLQHDDIMSVRLKLFTELSSSCYSVVILLSSSIICCLAHTMVLNRTVQFSLVFHTHTNGTLLTYSASFHDNVHCLCPDVLY